MIFRVWHNLLGMEKHGLDWHRADIAEELAEYEQAKGCGERWSELSDIVYTYTRARWSEHTDIVFPLSQHAFVLGAVYMFPKYTLRWLFFVTASRLAKAGQVMHEVRNPRKLSKLDDIAEKYGVEKESFRRVCLKLLNYWVLLD